MRGVGAEPGVCVAALLWSAVLCGHGVADERRTPEYLNTVPGVEYVGDEACGSCHRSEFANFRRTAMGRSMRLPSVAADAGRSAAPIKVSGQEPGVTYSIYARNGKVFHSEKAVDDTGREIYSDAHELAYCVGAGEQGRSYFIRRGEYLFVSPLSYYAADKRWDLSPGNDTGIHRGFTRQAGDLCVYCHSGLPQRVPGSFNRFREARLGALAIGCERCHGPGQIHVRQRRAGVVPSIPVDWSIVNPAKLPESRRDDVCNQCHLAGDARVLKPGKEYEDFRPGTSLDSVVAIFSVPAALKPAGLRALSQVDQLHLSRCWVASAGRLGCITCHDPHVEPRGDEAVAFYRERCLTCHTARSCTATAALRQRTRPADNCIGCHMPQRALTNIGHTALTDHRIARSPDADGAGAGAGDASAALIRETHPTGAGSSDSPDELRTMALAYAQVAQNYGLFGAQGFPLLERAAQVLSRDPEVQATWGLVLLKARPAERTAAQEALQHALELGSKSIDARLQLAGLRLEEGSFDAALQLCEDAIRMDPYSSAAHMRLARIYGVSGDHAKAVSALEQLLVFDPANQTARRALQDERAARR